MQETKPPVVVPGSETNMPVLPLRDVVVFPHGDPHVVSSAVGMRAPPDPAGYFEANAVHISSASLGDKNPGVNASVQFQIGYAWWRYKVRH